MIPTVEGASALWERHLYRSPLPPPEEGPKEPQRFVLGIDEAGRGPVLGPMVYAVALCPESYHEQVGTAGFNDSKALTEARRDELYEIMDKDPLLAYATLALSPSSISQGMLRRIPHNLNAQALTATVELIAGVLEAGIEVSTVFVDTLGDADRHRRTLESHFSMARYKDIKWIVESKADAKYPVTGAASIAAKVTRDAFLKPWNYAEPGLGGTEPDPVPEPESEQEEEEEVEEVEKALGKRSRSRKKAPSKKSKTVPSGPPPTPDQMAFWAPGSGYPSDPTTSAYLQRVLDPVFGWPNIVRFSWATCKNILSEKTRTSKPAPSKAPRMATTARAARAAKRSMDDEPDPEAEDEPVAAASPFGTLLPSNSKAYNVRWTDEPPLLTSFFGKSSAKKAPEAEDSPSWQRTSQAAIAAHTKARIGITYDLGLQPTTLGFL